MSLPLPQLFQAHWSRRYRSILPRVLNILLKLRLSMLSEQGYQSRGTGTEMGLGDDLFPVLESHTADRIEAALEL